MKVLLLELVNFADLERRHAATSNKDLGIISLRVLLRFLLIYLFKHPAWMFPLQAFTTTMIVFIDLFYWQDRVLA